MIIQCDSCQATYDFPADRIPAGGLKAKCAECGKVLNIRHAAGGRPDAPAGRPARPASTEPQSISAPPPKVQAPIDAPPPRRKPSGQPSVIVDMGQLNDPVETAAAAQAAAQQIAFAPLASGAIEVPPEPERHRVREMPAFGGPDPSEIQEIKPPSMAKWAVLGVVLVLLGFGGWVAAANDFEPIWYQDPLTATKRAVGFEKAPEPPPAPKEVQEAPPMVGELAVEDVEMTMLKQGRRRLAILRGQVVNRSNRLQHSVVFDADLIDAESAQELSLATRKADCCATFDDAEAKAAARDPDHPHFAEKSGGENVRLAPGESRRFTIVMRDLDPALDRKPVAPRVQIRFAEVEHPR